jgi:hypothetical protein
MLGSLLLTLVVQVLKYILVYPYPLFQWYEQSKDPFYPTQYEMLKNSAFNAQGSRVIIVIVQVGAVKIYAAG